MSRQLPNTGAFLSAGLFLALALAGPASAPAQVVNGDFEQGGTGWNALLPNDRWTISFPAQGGNPDGYGRIQSPFGDSGGTGCITQTFLCGEQGGPGLCTITVDYQHGTIDANKNAGRVLIRLNNQVVYTSPPENQSPWRTINFTSPCGLQRLELCLEVDAGNNGWAACFDNVEAECHRPTPSEDGTWGRIKAIYD
jgi:hypothetical protein